MQLKTLNMSIVDNSKDIKNIESGLKTEDAKIQTQRQPNY
jgi:hypothetical protein